MLSLIKQNLSAGNYYWRVTGFSQNDELKKYIVSHLSITEINRYVRTRGMTTMYEDGMEKVERGITTREEVLRVTHD